MNDQCQITSDSLKNMISDAVFRVRQELLSEQQRLFASLEEKIEKQIGEICRKVNDLTSNFEKNSDHLLNVLDIEFEDRMSRRSNVIFYGVEEAEALADADTRKAHDQRALNHLLKTMEVSEDSSSFKLRRFGVPTPNKTRLLHVQCKDIAMRDNILRNRTKLRFLHQKVFVQPDLTSMQQERAKALRQDLKRRRDMGEDVAIQNNKIVPSRRR
jgi:molybdopterin converting factor small subunit